MDFISNSIMKLSISGTWNLPLTEEDDTAKEEREEDTLKETSLNGGLLEKNSVKWTILHSTRPIRGRVE